MRESHHRSRPAAKLAAGLVAAVLIAAGASYAAVRPGSDPRPMRHAPPASPVTADAPLTATGSSVLSIAGHPNAVTNRSTARFRIVAAGEPALRCRLDGQQPQPCEPKVTYSGLDAGDHTFLVAARRPGRPTVRADFGWRVLEAEPFEVEPRPGSVGPLYPGAAPLPIRVVISNPNDVPIIVTALKVTATKGAPGCDPATNLVLTAPALGNSEPRIPAGGSITLPSATVPAPTIALRELGVNQDACRDATFNLSFSGSAGS
ncbi:MAG: hypothetical protein JST59_06190 [Actinobacteria bacterium]|nr:hypothetical protein [Actinomycetota bacterium]